MHGTSVFGGKLDAMERSAGRLDFKLSPLLYEQLVTEEDRAAVAKEIASVAKAVGFKGELHTSFHVMVVEPGAVDQAWHYDNDSAVFFLTLLMPLTPPTAKCGRTEFQDEAAPLLVPVGSCVVFDGKVFHRGTANRSPEKRIFAYVAATSEEDANDENNDGGLMEPEMVVHRSMRCGDLTITAGRWYNFQGEEKNDLWPAMVHAIFWERGRRQDAALSVQWLYNKQQCLMEGAEELYTDTKERLFSQHFDEVQVASCVSKCEVRFLPKPNTKCDYAVRQFYDHVKKQVRPLTRADIYGTRPAAPVVDASDVAGGVAEEGEQAVLQEAEPKQKRGRKKRQFIR